MRNNDVILSNVTLIKSLILSFFLLAFAFSAGLIIGRNDTGAVDRTSADQGDLQEKFSDCNYKLQEITTKYFNLNDVAKEKGLINKDNRIDPEVVCSIPLEEPASENLSEQKPDDDPSVSEKKIEAKTEEKADEKNKQCLFSIQLFADTNKEQALTAQKKYNIPETKLIEAVVKEKSWYRVRYGCFSTRFEAEQKLPEIKELVNGAIVVAE